MTVEVPEYCAQAIEKLAWKCDWDVDEMTSQMLLFATTMAVSKQGQMVYAEADEDTVDAFFGDLGAVASDALQLARRAMDERIAILKLTSRQLHDLAAIGAAMDEDSLIEAQGFSALNRKRAYAMAGALTIIRHCSRRAASVFGPYVEGRHGKTSASQKRDMQAELLKAWKRIEARSKPKRKGP